MTESNEQISAAFSKAAAICSKAEKSPLSIEKKIIQWGLNSDDSNVVLQKLFEHNFLNEQRFATSYVRDKYRFNRWGRIKIRYFLKNEGISNECITEALNEIDTEQYQQNLHSLLTEKYRKTKAKDAYDLKVKLIRYALSRGFENDIISLCYEQIVNSED